MGKSFLLKDRAGKLAGYVQLMQGVARYRVYGKLPEGGAAIRFFYEDGSSVERGLSGSQKEYEDVLDGERVCGACVICSDLLYADTGDDAKKLFSEAKMKAVVKEAETASHHGLTLECAQQESGSKKIEGQSRELPQRRWPPPPCCLRVRYEDGAWIEC